MEKYQNDLRKELEELKKRAEGVFRRGGGGARSPHPAGGRVSGRPGGRDVAKRPFGPLETLVPGEDCEFGDSVFYRVCTGAETIWEDADAVLGQYLETLAHPFPADDEGLAPLKVLRDIPPDETCYLDLETTGLGMTPLFLVGLMYTSGGRLMIDQLFARDYTEEPAVLGYTRDLLERFKLVVTFNGITFDIPFLGQRMAYTGIEFGLAGAHLDILPLARGLLRGRTPNNRLQTLERYLCGRKRIGDVPGREIPGVYHEFVRTGDAGSLAAVFHHNRLDLLTMLQLATVFLSGRYRADDV